MKKIDFKKDFKELFLLPPRREVTVHTNQVDLPSEIHLIIH